MRVKVSVTEDDIKHGCVENCFTCPCATALSRVVNNTVKSVSMGGIMGRTQFSALYADVEGFGKVLHKTRVPEEAVKWQTSLSYVREENDGNYARNAAGTFTFYDDSWLEIVPKPDRAKTLGPFEFYLNIPKKFLKEEVIKENTPATPS